MKQKGLLKAEEIHLGEQILFHFVQNESFPNVSKSIADSKEISNTLNIAKFSHFIKKTEKFEWRIDRNIWISITMQNIQYYWQQNIQL